jgi:hypothetical protein
MTVDIGGSSVVVSVVVFVVPSVVVSVVAWMAASVAVLSTCVLPGLSLGGSGELPWEPCGPTAAPEAFFASRLARSAMSRQRVNAPERVLSRAAKGRKTHDAHTA